MSCESETEENGRLPPLKKKRRNKKFFPRILSPFKRSPKKNSVTPADQQITCCKKDFDNKPPKIEICSVLNDTVSIKSITHSVRSFISGSIISDDWNPTNGLQYIPNKQNGKTPSVNSISVGRRHSHTPRSPSLGSNSLGLPHMPRKERANSDVSIFTDADVPTMRSGAYMPGFAVNRFK